MTAVSPLPKYIIITRPLSDDMTFKKRLEKNGLLVFSSQSIAIKQNLSAESITASLSDITMYDWILFTSGNGVRFFMQAIQHTLGSFTNVQQISLAAVGIQTAREAEKYNLQVQHIPANFTAEDLAEELPDILGKRILLPQSAIANPQLKEKLEKRGAIVTVLPIYTIEYVTKKKKQLNMLVENGQISCLTFTSPSTVKGFMKNFTDRKKIAVLSSLPVISIGPVTTKSAMTNGFTNVYTADVHTTQGMIKKLKETLFL